MSSRMLLVSAAILAGCSSDKEVTSPEDTPNDPPNHPPILEAQADTTGAVGDTLRLVARATDPDEHVLTYSLVVEISLDELHEGYEANVSLNRGTGAFWFVPSNEDRPSRAFEFHVDDGHGGTDWDGFTVSTP